MLSAGFDIGLSGGGADFFTASGVPVADTVGKFGVGVALIVTGGVLDIFADLLVSDKGRSKVLGTVACLPASSICNTTSANGSETGAEDCTTSLPLFAEVFTNLTVIGTLCFNCKLA